MGQPRSGHAAIDQARAMTTRRKFIACLALAPALPLLSGCKVKKPVANRREGLTMAKLLNAREVLSAYEIAGACAQDPDWMALARYFSPPKRGAHARA